MRGVPEHQEFPPDITNQHFGMSRLLSALLLAKAGTFVS
jgi:hypothetical protein